MSSADTPVRRIDKYLQNPDSLPTTTPKQPRVSYERKGWSSSRIRAVEVYLVGAGVEGRTTWSSRGAHDERLASRRRHDASNRGGESGRAVRGVDRVRFLEESVDFGRVERHVRSVRGAAFRLVRQL